MFSDILAMTVCVYVYFYTAFQEKPQTVFNIDKLK